MSCSCSHPDLLKHKLKQQVIDQYEYCRVSKCHLMLTGPILVGKFIPKKHVNLDNLNLQQNTLDHKFFALLRQINALEYSI